MKLGLTTDSFGPAIQGGRMNLSKIIEFAKQREFEGIEIVNRKDIWRRDIGDDIKMNMTRMRENKLRYFSYGVNYDLAVSDSQVRWRSMNKIREAILLACTTNSPDVCVLGTGLTEPELAWDDVSSYVIEGLKDCLQLAEKKRINLSIKNGGRICNGSDRMLQILNEIGSENLQVSIDVAAFLLVDEEPADAVRTLQGSINNVHFTGVRNADTYVGNEWVTLGGRQLEPCVLGEGIVPQREVLYTLKQINYEGFVIVLYQGSEEPAVGIERSSNYLKTMLKEIKK